MPTVAGRTLRLRAGDRKDDPTPSQPSFLINPPGILAREAPSNRECSRLKAKKSERILCGPLRFCVADTLHRITPTGLLTIVTDCRQPSKSRRECRVARTGAMTVFECLAINRPTKRTPFLPTLPVLIYEAISITR